MGPREGLWTRAHELRLPAKGPWAHGSRARHGAWGQTLAGTKKFICWGDSWGRSWEELIWLSVEICCTGS